MRVIVCGGRDYYNKRVVFAALDRLHAKCGIEELLQGGANGADYLARQWADERGIPCRSYAADWDAFGRAAGPLRNQQLIDGGRPDGVVAFPGGKGTADMIARAKRSGLVVWRPAESRPW